MSAKIVTKEDIEDKLNSIIHQRDKLIIELNSLNESLINLLEQKYSLDPLMIQIECIQCNGVGRMKNEEGKLIKCPICRETGYNWVKRFIKHGE